MRRVRLEGVVSVGGGVVPEYVLGEAAVSIKGIGKCPSKGQTLPFDEAGQSGKVKKENCREKNDLGRIYI